MGRSSGLGRYSNPRQWNNSSNDARNTSDNQNNSNSHGNVVEKNDEYHPAGELKFVEMSVGGVTIDNALFDTGANVSIVGQDIVDRMTNVNIDYESKSGATVANGDRIHFIGKVEAPIKSVYGNAMATFYITEGTREITIIGRRTMIQMGIKSVPLNEFAPHNFVSDRDAIVSEEITIDPGEIASLAIENTDENYEGITVLWSEDEMICDSVIDKSENMTKIHALNTGSSSITFEKGQKIGSFVKIGDTVIDSDELEERHSLEERHVNMVLSEKPDEKKRLDRLIEVLENNREKEKLPPDIRDIVKRHEYAFALSDSELGMAKGVECKIETEGEPFRMKPRPVPFSVRENLRELLDKMEKNGIIRESNSPWCSPVVLVRKKNGDIRLCIDYRRLNTMIVKDAHPLPNIDATLQ